MDESIRSNWHFNIRNTFSNMLETFTEKSIEFHEILLYFANIENSYYMNTCSDSVIIKDLIHDYYTFYIDSSDNIQRRCSWSNMLSSRHKVCWFQLGLRSNSEEQGTIGINTLCVKNDRKIAGLKTYSNQSRKYT